MSTENITTNSLKELGGSDYEIADGQPDIRGWDVKDESGKKIGKVKELLFDEASRKVRYIVQDLKGNDYDLESRKVLVPIGIAQLDKDDDDVILPGVTASQLKMLPEYEEDSLTAEKEHNIRNIFAGLGGAALAGTAISESDNFYSHDHFNEDNLYNRRNTADISNQSETIPVIKEELQVGKREVETGGLRLKSRIVETPVQEDINLREEKVFVERTPVDRLANPADIREESLELTERAEVPVVAKEARVVEEVSLNKDVTEKEEVVRDTIKNTEIDIEKTDDEKNISGGTTGF